MPLVRKPTGGPVPIHPLAIPRRCSIALASRHGGRALGCGPRGRRAARRRSGPRRGAGAGTEPARARGHVHGAGPNRHAAERRDWFCPFFAPTTRSCAREPRTPCTRCKSAAWPPSATRCCRIPTRTSGFSPAAWSARCPDETVAALALRPARFGARAERLRRGRRRRWRRSAELKRCPCWRAARSVSRRPRFSDSRSRSRSIASAPRLPARVPEFRGAHARTSFAGCASSSTDEPGWSSPRRSAITSSAASSNGWSRDRLARLSKTISRGCAVDLRGEIEQFVNAFTVNETYFYREEHQLACLTLRPAGGQAEGEAARRARSESGRCRARPARSRTRSPSGCSKTGRWWTSTRSRSSAPTSTRTPSRWHAPACMAKRALMRLPPLLGG